MDFNAYILDTNILGMLVLSSKKNSLFNMWIDNLDFENNIICISEIVDYELRRELIRRGSTKNIEVLDGLKEDFFYLPINTSAMLLAANLWAEARKKGYQTAPNHSLDVDVILAAQTIDLIENGYNAIVKTENVKHLSRYTNAQTWEKL